MIGQPRVHHRLTDSTNERARELASRGAPHGTLVTADEQTAGRGRQGREWVAVPGSALLMSVVLRSASATLPLAAAVAVCEALPVDAAIKWPNDIWVERCKVAGILVEARPQEGWAVLGIGVNVRDAPALEHLLGAHAGAERCRVFERRRLVHVHPNAQHRPALPRPRLDEDPGDLPSLDPDVVRPLDGRLHRQRLAHRDRRRQWQRGGGVVEDEREEEGRARSGRPRAALPPAPGRLLAGRDERAVRRSRGGQGAGALVRRVGHPVVDPGPPDHRGRSRTSASGWSPSVPAASPRLIATASVRYASS